MALTPLPYPDFRPYSNVQPFTVRDGATYLLILEEMRTWIRDNLVPELDKEIGELVANWLEISKNLVDSVNDQLRAQDEAFAQLLVQQGLDFVAMVAAQNEAFAQTVLELTESVDSRASAMEVYVNEAVASIINSTIAVTDPVTTAILQNESSNTVGVLNDNYIPVRAVKGNVKDGIVDAREAIAAADALAVASGRPVMLPAGTYRVASALTINSQVIFQPGAVIKPSSGIAVVLAKGMVDTFTTVFDQSLGGTVFPVGMVAYRPVWYGAVNTDNDSNSWVQLFAARNAYNSGLRIVVKAPTGSNRVWNVSLGFADIDFVGSSIAPVVALAGGDGYMFQLLPWVTIRGGYFSSGNTNNIRILYQTGHRCYVEGAYFSPQGNNDTYGFYATVASGSSTPRLMNCIFYAGNGTGTGAYLDSPDAELTNCWFGLLGRGFIASRGSATITGVHVWECYDIGASVADGSRVSGCYFETMRGWGLRSNGGDRIIIENSHFWKNGTHTADTGGLLFEAPAVSSIDNIIRNVIFDDNYGVGLRLNGTTRADIDVMIGSSSRQGGGAALGTTGVDITVNSAYTDLRVRGSRASVTGALVADVSNSTRLDLGKSRGALVEPITIGVGDVAFRTVARAPMTRSDQWSFRGQAFITVAAGTNATFVIQGTGGGSEVTGVWGIPEIAGNNTRNLINSGGGFLTVTGTGNIQLVTFHGFIKLAGSADAVLDVRVRRGTETAETLTVHSVELEASRNY